MTYVLVACIAVTGKRLKTNISACRCTAPIWQPKCSPRAAVRCPVSTVMAAVVSTPVQSAIEDFFWAVDRHAIAEIRANVRCHGATAGDEDAVVITALWEVYPSDCATSAAIRRDGTARESALLGADCDLDGDGALNAVIREDADVARREATSAADALRARIALPPRPVDGGDDAQIGWRALTADTLANAEWLPCICGVRPPQQGGGRQQRGDVRAVQPAGHSRACAQHAYDVARARAQELENRARSELAKLREWRRPTGGGRGSAAAVGGVLAYYSERIRDLRTERAAADRAASAALFALHNPVAASALGEEGSSASNAGPSSGRTRGVSAGRYAAVDAGVSRASHGSAAATCGNTVLAPSTGDALRCGVGSDDCAAGIATAAGAWRAVGSARDRRRPNSVHSEGGGRSHAPAAALPRVPSRLQHTWAPKHLPPTPSHTAGSPMPLPPADCGRPQPSASTCSDTAPSRRDSYASTSSCPPTLVPVALTATDTNRRWIGRHAASETPPTIDLHGQRVSEALALVDALLEGAVREGTSRRLRLVTGAARASSGSMVKAVGSKLHALASSGHLIRSVTAMPGSAGFEVELKL